MYKYNNSHRQRKTNTCIYMQKHTILMLTFYEPYHRAIFPYRTTKHIYNMLYTSYNYSSNLTGEVPYSIGHLSSHLIFYHHLARLEVSLTPVTVTVSLKLICG